MKTFTNPDAAKARLEYVLWRVRRDRHTLDVYDFWLYGDWSVRKITGECADYFIVRTPDSAAFVVTPDVEVVEDFIRKWALRLIDAAEVAAETAEAVPA